jgi:D-beta-D-heptose 7-phosphate kinase/D-beta-D-heptose 1-phosphate adenosyltransferase
MVRIAVSGGFDPLHVGHVRYIKEASLRGDVVVILNSDEWLVRKKGYVFMPWEQRAEILREIRGVVEVVKADDGDDTVCATLERLKPDYFAKGGDRNSENTPEIETCLNNGIGIIWGCGGGKIASSQGIVDAIR